MPYFPGEYNPTSVTGPAELLQRTYEPVRQRLGGALDQTRDRDTRWAHEIRLLGERDHASSHSLARQAAFEHLRSRYPDASEREIQGFLDRLADQANNLPFFRDERSRIFADDLIRFLRQRRY